MGVVIICLLAELTVFFSEQNFTFCADRNISANNNFCILLADLLAWAKQLFEET